MEPRDILITRLQALILQLEQAERLLASEGIEKKLRERMGPILQNEIEDQRRKVERDLCIVKDKEPSQSSWTSLRTRSDQCAVLFRECLAYLQGAHARTRNVDGQLCEIADAMLDELDKVCGLGWRRFTLFAENEFFNDLAQIIRLRFPCCGIWDLPVAAHEFGHFAAYRLSVPDGDGSRSGAFKEYCEAYLQQHPTLGGEWKYYLEEFFADAFATYVLGPSYACTSLLLRFGVAEADEENDHLHPSYAKRALVILDVLRRMNSEADSRGAFRPTISLLEQRWMSILTSAGRICEVSSIDKDQLVGFAREFFSMLKRGARAGRYSRWDKARELADIVKSSADNQELECDIRDLLNAAWLVRLQPMNSPERISDKVIALCSRKVH